MLRYEFSKFGLKINKEETNLISRRSDGPWRLVLAMESLLTFEPKF